MKSRSQIRHETAAVSLTSITSEDQVESDKNVPILNERNFREWRRKIVAYLYKKGVYMALNADGISSEPVMQQAQQKAYGIILEHLPAGMMEKYLDDDTIDTPKKLMESVTNTRTSINAHLVRAIMARITSFSWETADPEREYNRFLKIYHEHLSAGGTMNEEEAIYYFLACPNGRFISTCEYIKFANITTLDKAYTKLIVKDQEIKHAINLRKKNDRKPPPKPAKQDRGKHKHKHDSDTKALFCAYCKAEDHVISECKRLQKKKQKEKTKANVAVEETKAEPTIGLTATIPQANISETRKKYSDAIWILDSGATKHMSGDREVFFEFEECPIQDYIEVANNERLPITGSGKVRLWANKTRLNLEINDVVYAPKLAKNLFSIRAASKRGCTVQFYNDGATIYKDNAAIIHAELKDGLYILNNSLQRGRQEQSFVSKIEDTTSSKYDQHVKMCHFRKPKGVQCTACDEAKVNRTIAKVHDEAKSTQTLQLVHSDVMDLPVPSLGGKRYLLSFIDDYSRYTQVRFLRNKSEANAALRQLITDAETQTGHKLKVLRCDKGGEYISKEFKRYLSEKGTHMQETHLDAPYENGVAERYNRTMLTASRTMFADSNQPETYWAEAMNTANYVKNRIEHATTQAIPYERYFGHQPMTSHLQQWGCPAIIHVQGRNKLKPKGKRVIFIGYNEKNTKGYRFLNPKNGKVYLSKDATFKSMPNRTTSPINVPGIIEYAIIAEAKTPDNYCEAIKSSEAEKWRAAMNDEIRSLLEKRCWMLVDRPKNVKILKGRWAFAKKKNSMGIVIRHKARHAINGFNQKKGQDFIESFSPVARIETIRVILIVAHNKGYVIHQMDIKLAYINGDMDTIIYMEQPEGFCEDPSKVCLLLKSLYGLKQSGRCWNIKFVKFMKDLGFEQAKSDPCVFTKKDLIIALYVDDLIIAGTPEEVRKFKQQLKDTFEAEDMGIINHILGIKVEFEEDTMMLSQTAFINQCLEKFNMQKAKEKATPMEAIDMDEVDQLTEDQQQLYRSVVGCLLYLSNNTRPDIAFATQYLSRFLSKAFKFQLNQALRVFRYLKGTKEMKLHIKREEDFSMQVYADASYGSTIDRKSISGSITFIYNSPALWFTRKQTITAQSTVEAEYISLSETAKSTYWVIQLLNELNINYQLPVIIHQDNQGTIQLSKNPIIGKRSKHIDIKYHHVRESIESGLLKPIYCDTQSMIADMLTKPLTVTSFERLRSLIGVHDKRK